MAEFNVPIYDFRYGVLTQKLKDRPNLDLYKSGVQVGENFLTQLHGPTTYRPGFEHSRTTRRNNIAHFIPFTFADDEAYILSFTDGYMRIFTDGGVVTEDPLSISAITQADPGIVTVVGNDYTNGDEIYIDGCIGMTDLNGQFFLVVGTVTPGTSEKNWPYSVPGNYTYNASDIEVTAGVAKLKSSGSSTDFPFTTPANYTYDSALIEVTGGNAQLIQRSIYDDVVLLYHMDAASWSGTPGEVIDNGPNSNDGVAIGGATTSASGILDRAGSFDGINDGVQITDAASLQNIFATGGSISIWARPDTLGGGNFGRLFDKAKVILDNRNSGTEKLSFFQDFTVTDGQWTTPNNSITLGAWNHIVVVYSSVSTSVDPIIYINNVSVAITEVGTPAGTPVSDAGDDLYLGNRADQIRGFDGLLDEVVFYDTVLTAPQVATLYNNGLATKVTQYPVDSPSIENNTGAVFASALNTFAETATKPAGSVLQYQVSSDDGTTFKWWSGASWDARTLTFPPSAVSTTAGTPTGGDVASLAVVDANTYDVSEVSATPGLTIEIDFANMGNGPGNIYINSSRVDGSAQTINVEIWNYDTLAWDNVGTLPVNAVITLDSYAVGGTPADYVSTEGAVRVRLNHPSHGAPAHSISIDRVAIDSLPTDAWYFANETNPASTIQTNIGTLAASGTFKFIAFLNSDGTVNPQLDNIEVGDLGFPLTDPTIESDSTFPFTAALSDFTETATKPASTEIQYIVSIDGGSTFLWWSGAAWVASNGTYAESNLASVVDTNIAALGASGTFTYKAFLHTSDLLATPELNNVHTEFTVVPSDTFNITDQDGNLIDTSGFEAYTGGGTAARVYEIESPYLEADLPQLKFAQKADIMYIDHPSYLPRKLTRFGDGTWTLTIYTRTSDPFEQKVITNITQANPGVVTSTAHGYVNDDLVLIEDVSGMTEVNHVVYTVTKITDDTYSIGVNTTGYTAYDSGGASIYDGDAPATVGFYGGRVFHGGSLNDPDLIFGSMSPDPSDGSTRYEDFTVGSDPDDGISYALTSASTSSVDRVRFFMGTRQFLAVGTYAGMLKVNGGSDATPISATAIESYPVDNFGVADIMPVNFGTDIIYVQRGAEVVYSFKYTLLSDGWKSEDETIQSDEITADGIKQLAYQQGNPNQVWAAMIDGRLLSFVYSDTESVSAWNEHIVGGEGTVLTVAAQPQDDNRDRVWIAVERVIDGVTRRYVEYLAKNPKIPERDDFYSGSDSTAEDTDDMLYRNQMFYAQKRQIHMDSALSLDTTQSTTITPAATTGSDISFVAGESIFSADDLLRKIQIKYLTGTESGIARITEYVSETEVLCEILQDFESTDTIPSGAWYFTQDTVDGLDHLEGETVSIVADGGIHPDRVVTDGTITLVGQATYVMVGLFYYGRVKTMPLELLLSTGITPGKFKSVNKINLMFRNTLGVSYGTDPYDMQRIGFRQGPQFTGRPTFLFNGVKEQPGFDNYDEQRSMWIIQTVPYPCTVNSMVLDMEFSQEN